VRVVYYRTSAGGNSCNKYDPHGGTREPTTDHESRGRISFCTDVRAETVSDEQDSQSSSSTFFWTNACCFVSTFRRTFDMSCKSCRGTRWKTPKKTLFSGTHRKQITITYKNVNATVHHIRRQWRYQMHDDVSFDRNVLLCSFDSFAIVPLRFPHCSNAVITMW